MLPSQKRVTTDAGFVKPAKNHCIIVVHCAPSHGFKSRTDGNRSVPDQVTE